MGFGRGAASSEYVNFGIDHTESQARYLETIEMVEALWTTPDYTHEGKYHTAKNVNLVPTPLQDPHPPVYVAATRSAESLDFVASTGRRLIVGVVLNTDDAVELLGRFCKCQSRRVMTPARRTCRFSGISTWPKPRSRRTARHGKR